MSLTRAVDPTIQAVFDALLAVLAADPNRVNVNAYASKDSGGQTEGITISDKYGSTETYSNRIVVGKVFLDPMTGSTGPTETVQFTATTLDDTGTAVPATVTWSVQQGALGTVSATGLYTAPSTIATTAVDYVTAKNATGSSATASVSLHP
jgi:hypothetical protein